MNVFRRDRLESQEKLAHFNADQIYWRRLTEGAYEGLKENLYFNKLS
jgi:hypothetical protein